MKIQIAKDQLQLSVTRANGAVVERNLAHFGLKASNGTLQIAAADRMLSIFSEHPCEIMQEGVVFVPAKIFSEIVRELPNGPLRIEKTGAHVLMTAGAQDEFEMKLPVVEDLVWKDTPQIQSKCKIDFPALKLAYMIDQVQFCLAEDSPRNYGSVGFLHKIAAERVRLTATDGFRLSYSEIEQKFPATFLDKGVCLSKRALSELQRMCQEGFSSIKLAIADDLTTLIAEAQDYRIYVRLSAVEFPDYQSVLPQTKYSAQSLLKPHLQSVSRRVLLAADRARTLQLSFSENQMTLTARNVGSTESKESISLDKYKGPSCKITVNGKYFTDILSTMTDEKFGLYFKSPEEPVVITPDKDLEGCKTLHLLMPIKDS
jgi:DNA polymerase-3 subunit beta